MRWLVHGSLTPAVAEALQRHGDMAQDVASVIAPGESAGLHEVLKAAHKAQLDLMTNDAALVDAVFDEEAPRFGRSIVFLRLEGQEIEQAAAIDRLFARYKRLAPGRLYTVTASRVKVRQLPGRLG